MTDTSARDAAGFSAPNDTIDLPSKLACEVMGLDWIRRHSADADEHCDHHGQLQELFAAALAPDPAIPGPGAGDGNWHPISTAPKDGTRILLLTGRDEVAVGRWFDDTGQHFGWIGWDADIGRLMNAHVVGWQRLPVPSTTRPAQPAATPGASEGLRKTIAEALELGVCSRCNRPCDAGSNCTPIDCDSRACNWREATQDEQVNRLVALLAAIASAPEQGVGRERVRHVKRGSEYEVLHRGVSLQISRVEADTSPVPMLCEGHRLTVYRSTDGKIWAREEAEFDDGRFAPIASPAPSHEEA